MAATRNSGSSRVYKTVKPETASTSPVIGTLVDIKDLKKGQYFELTDEDPYAKIYYKGFMGKAYICSQEARAGGAPVGYNNLGSHVGFYEIKKVKLAPEFALDFSKLNFSSRVAMTGCDPEIFITKKDGSLIPAFNFLPFQRECVRPATLSECPDGSGVTSGRIKTYWAPHYADGFAAEFGMKPGSCHGWGMDRVRFGLELIYNKMKAHDKDANLTLQNVVAIDPEILASASADQIALGCSPSKNAYGDEVPLPTDARTLPFRVAGGHIHFGMSNINSPEGEMSRTDRNELAAKWMDMVVGVPAVALFEGIDSPTRRRFYGRAGEYRDKSYGLEYRTLSNAWLGHPAIAHLIWNLARTGASIPDQGFPIKSPAQELKFDENEIKDIINNCDVEAARAFITKHKVIYTNALVVNYGRYGDAGMTAVSGNQPLDLVDRAFKLFDVGVKKAIPAYEDIEKNWKLDKGEWLSHTNNSYLTWSGYAHHVKV